MSLSLVLRSGAFRNLAPLLPRLQLRQLIIDAPGGQCEF